MKPWCLALAVIACSKHDDAPNPARPDEPTAVPAPKVAATSPPPEVAAGTEVTEMAVRGYLRIEDASGKREEPLPESPLGHGEFPEGCYTASDGTIYAVGKQYTGVDGPDDGAVWKRAPNGAWSTPFRLERRQLSSIAGIAPDDIVAGGSRGYAWWNGKTWTVHDTPQAIVKVWTDGHAIYGTDFDITLTFRIDHGEPKPIAKLDHDWRDDKYICSRGSTHARVFDKSTPMGTRKLSPGEAAEIRQEVKEIEAHPERVRAVKP
jgi:hypothetical protein